MIISHSHQFLFVHIPKTAGTSIELALEPFATQVKRFPENRLARTLRIKANYLTLPRRRMFSRHATARTARRYLPAAVFERLFKFAIVRNPWDRLSSEYHYLLRKQNHRLHRQVHAMSGFAEYVAWQTKLRRPTQSSYVYDQAGKLLVDFVGRFERLNEDMLCLQEMLGIELDLPHVNRTKRNDYREYFDAQSRSLAEDYFREDIERFGYTFDGEEAASAA